MCVKHLNTLRGVYRLTPAALENGPFVVDVAVNGEIMATQLLPAGQLFVEFFKENI